MATESPAVSTPSSSGVSTVAFDDFTVTSNSETVEQLTEQRDKERATEVSKAAKALGEKGGKASAEARAAKPIKPTKAFEAKPEEVKADEFEPETKEQVAEPEPEKRSPRDDPKARMLEATREAAELKRQLAQRDADLAEARRAAQQPVEHQAKPGATYKEDPTVKPNPEHYTDTGEYIEDLTDWKARDTYMRGREYDQKRAAFEAQQKSYYDNVNTKIDTWNKKITDKWADVSAMEADGIDKRLIEWKTSLELGPNEPKTAQNAIADSLVAECDDAVAVMLYLSHNPEELETLLGLPSSHAVSRAIARLEGRATASSSAPKPTPKAEVSNAPKPVRSVSGTPHNSGEVDLFDDNVPFDKHVEAMNARDKKRGRRF